MRTVFSFMLALVWLAAAPAAHAQFGRGAANQSNEPERIALILAGSPDATPIPGQLADVSVLEQALYASGFKTTTKNRRTMDAEDLAEALDDFEDDAFDRPEIALLIILGAVKDGAVVDQDGTVAFTLDEARTRLRRAGPQHASVIVDAEYDLSNWACEDNESLLAARTPRDRPDGKPSPFVRALAASLLEGGTYEEILARVPDRVEGRALSLRAGSPVMGRPHFDGRGGELVSIAILRDEMLGGTTRSIGAPPPSRGPASAPQPPRGPGSQGPSANAPDRSIAVRHITPSLFGAATTATVRTVGPCTRAPSGVNREGRDEIRLLFGTNRRNDPDGRFGAGRDGRYRLGCASVSVPGAHQEGTLELPSEGLTIFGAQAEDPDRHFVMTEVEIMDEAAFQALRAIIASAAGEDANRAVIYVHGFNNTFESTALRSAQVVHDLEFKGEAYFFSWPSLGGITGYSYDEESVFTTSPILSDFLAYVRETTSAEEVTVIAHSMGARLTMGALRDLNRRREEDEGPYFTEVVLAAPDIDADDFVILADAVKGISEGITLYANANDGALDISQRVNRGGVRAGGVDPRTGPVRVAGVDVINITLVADEGETGHSAALEAASVVADMDTVVRRRVRPPETRSPAIERVDDPAGAFWVIQPGR